MLMKCTKKFNIECILTIFQFKNRFIEFIIIIKVKHWSLEWYLECIGMQMYLFKVRFVLYTSAIWIYIELRVVVRYRVITLFIFIYFVFLSHVLKIFCICLCFFMTLVLEYWRVYSVIIIIYKEMSNFLKERPDHEVNP